MQKRKNTINLLDLPTRVTSLNVEDVKNIFGGCQGDKKPCMDPLGGMWPALCCQGHTCVQETIDSPNTKTGKETHIYCKKN